MNYEKIIVELLSRIQTLEEQVAALKVTDAELKAEMDKAEKNMTETQLLKH